MADTTNIQWCDSPDGSKGATWNIITGCDFADDSCHGCYAARMAATRLKNIDSRKGLAEIRNGIPVWTGIVRFNHEWLEQPLRWKRGRRIFVCAHGDLFHEEVPDEWIDQIFAVMALCPQHTFLVLTKRAKRMREYLSKQRNQIALKMWPLPHVHLGVSFGRQDKAAERLYHLLQTPAALHWCSYEPALEMVDPTQLEYNEVTFNALDARGFMPARLGWGVVGGESGKRARPFDIDWARRWIVEFDVAGLPLFVKQMGQHPIDSETGSEILLDDSHGGDWNEWPVDLRVRQYPAAQS